MFVKRSALLIPILLFKLTKFYTPCLILPSKFVMFILLILLLSELKMMNLNYFQFLFYFIFILFLG